jgi:ABC-type bacteriocin/lantibiotic exporter with double-glycine peptidase domain
MKINKQSLLLPLKIVFKRTYLRNWVITSLLAITALGAGLAVPYLVKLTVDEGIAKKDLKYFLLLCLGAGVVIVTKHIFDAIISLRRSAQTAKMRFDLNRRIFKNIHAMPQAWFEQKGAGEAIYAIDNDSAALINIVGTITDGFILEAISVIVSLAMILALNLKIGVTVLLFLPVVFLIGVRRFKKLEELWRGMAGSGEAVLNYLEESFWRSYLIKIFNAAGQAARRYARLLLKDTRLAIKHERQEAWSSAAPAILPLAATGVIYVLSGYQAIMGKMTIGTLVAIGGYIYQFISAAGQLLFAWQELQPGLISAERLAPLLAPTNIDAAVDKKNTQISPGAIKIRGLYFSYAAGQNIFHDLNLDIAAGDYTAITGPSGCGKTTLLNLIMRLYPVEKGEIAIDGKNISSLPHSIMGREVIMCPQEPLLWNLSIAKNIAYHYQSAAEASVKEVALLTGADEFIKGLPQGYETILGENACRLSQGQKQRISLARALIKQPKILLLDEAFSGLPEEEEAKIVERIRVKFPAMTMIAATHRLASLQKAQAIIRL